MLSDCKEDALNFFLNLSGNLILFWKGTLGNFIFQIPCSSTFARMDSFWELMRSMHEQRDRLTSYCIDILANPPRAGHKERLSNEWHVANLLDKIVSTQAHIRKLHDQFSNLKKDESKEGDEETFYVGDLDPQYYVVKGLGANGEGDFGNFYRDLMEIKDYYEHRAQRTSSATGYLMADDEEAEFQAIVRECRPTNAAMKSMFTGEEAYGKYMDLHLHHQAYLALGLKKCDYLEYLDLFDKAATCVVASEVYEAYLKGLAEYLEDFIKRTKPLFDLRPLLEDERLKWSTLESNAEPPTNHDDGDHLRCEPCGKHFANEAVFKGHLTGHKHLKNASSPSTTRKKARKHPANKIQIYLSLIKRFMDELLGEVREDTRANVERKSILTPEERLTEALIEEREGEDNEVAPTTEKAMKKTKESGKGDEEEIYNPLKLPLDWDGKPIPFWLWRLHGLGVKFECEICGNYEYMGRRAFDAHFTEWRHVNAMKCLGIPNSKAFFQITRIDEARALWEKIKEDTRRERFKPEAQEECEDDQGNVYTRKTFEDLRRQGLL